MALTLESCTHHSRQVGLSGLFRPRESGVWLRALCRSSSAPTHPSAIQAALGIATCGSAQAFRPGECNFEIVAS